MVIGSSACAPLEGRGCQGYLIYQYAPENRCGCLCENLAVGDGSGEVTVQLLCMTLWWWIPVGGKGIVFILHNIYFPISNDLRKHIPHSLIPQRLKNWIWAKKICLLGCRDFPSWGHRLINPTQQGNGSGDPEPAQQEMLAKAPSAPGGFLAWLWGFAAPLAERSPWSDHGHSPAAVRQHVSHKWALSDASPAAFPNGAC